MILAIAIIAIDATQLYQRYQTRCMKKLLGVDHGTNEKLLGPDFFGQGACAWEVLYATKMSLSPQ